MRMALCTNEPDCLWTNKPSLPFQQATTNGLLRTTIRAENHFRALEMCADGPENIRNDTY